ncbi:MAG: DUF6159 family protein [Candidatus Korobacteraceae bacterium]
METIFRSWDLLGQSLVVLKSDKQLMWPPVLSAIFCLAATVTIFGSGLLFVLPPGPIPQDPAQQKVLWQQMAPFLFLFYFVTYSIAIYFNVALVSIASDRLAGGDASLNDGLQLAWKRKWSIFQWALLSATVGMLLQMLERRLKFLARFVASIIGLAWTLASFFVIPLLAAENIGPVEALSKSAHIFRKTWGEEVVGGFSFGLLFSLLALPGLLLPMLAVRSGLGPAAMLASVAGMVIYWLLLGVINSAARGIFVAALYRYANDQRVSVGFSRSDLSSAWMRKMD